MRYLNCFFVFVLANILSGNIYSQGDMDFLHRNGPVTPFDDYGGVFPADIDNDGDYDVLTFGADQVEGGGFTFSPAVLWNDGTGQYTAESLNLGYFKERPNSVCFLDFNNDNSVDIAISSEFSQIPYQTVLLANDGTGSFSLAGGFQSVDTVAPHMIYTLDYDNDGDMDILVRDYVRTIVRMEDIGYNGSLFENKGNGVFEFDYYFPRLHDLTVLDFNKDGRMDIAKIFQEWGFLGTTIENQLLVNQDGRLTRDPGIVIPYDKISSVNTLDINSDGYGDLYIRGTNGDGYVDYFMINDQGEGMIQQEAGMHPGLDDFLSDPNFKWGDLNLDNRSDLMITYRYDDTVRIETWLQKEGPLGFDLQQGATNPALLRPDTKITTIFPYSDWHDMDGDGKTDVFFGLRDHVDSLSGHIFRNEGDFQVMENPVPEGLSHFREGSGIVLSWSTPDEETWSYNVRVGSVPGGVDVTSPLADPVSGFLRIPSAGNASFNDLYLLDTLAEGKYYWSVQSVSKSYKGGNWSEEKSFIIGDVYVDFEADTICLGETTIFKNLSQLEDWGLDSVLWNFGDGRNSDGYAPEHQYLSSGRFEVSVNFYTGGENYSATREVMVKAAPHADFILEDHCLGQLSPINNLSEDHGSGINFWMWDFGDGTRLNETNPENHGFVSSGTYNVKLVLGSENGCGDSLTRVVNVLPIPQVELVPEGRPCVDHGFLLSTQYSPAFTYQWKYAGGDISGANTATYSPNIPGSYSVVVSSQCGEVSDSYMVPEPEFQILAEGTPCKAGDFRLSVSEEELYNYQWRVGGIEIQGANLALYYPDKVGTFSVAVGTACGEYGADYIVELLGGPEKPEIIVKGPVVWILACSNDSAEEYQWYRDGALIKGAVESVYIPDAEHGSYHVSISDGSECYTSSDPVQIPPSTSIEELPLGDLKIYPNPTSGEIYLKMDNDITGELILDIFNEQGIRVRNFIFQKETSHFVAQIDLSAQAAGVYMIGMKIDKYTANRVLIVE